MSTLDAVDFFRSQLCVKLPSPTKLYTGQTIIVTGSNVGLGLETARHFVRLGANKVILAVRNLSKGQSAAQSIEASTGKPGVVVVEVWELDLTSHASVLSFAKRASGLDRLDVVVNNAGILVYDFEMADGNESTITVNVISPMLLSILLLPKLRETSVNFKKEVVLTFTGSFVHFMTDFPERENKEIFKALALESDAQMPTRYYVSKLIQLLVVRELADQVTASSKPGNVTISIFNPGFFKSEVMRHAGAIFQLFFRPYRKLVARSTEEASRTAMHAAAGGKETHGQYLGDCAIKPTSKFVTSTEGHEVQKKLWGELSNILDDINAGIMSTI
ncbi:putative short-chain dehydrogenase/reductase family protein [Xylariales sp. PMI_506]|nr:putative short-chain dehydrogenase/reductase family protein [Xylariales sp. PMI_506]